MFQKIFQIVKAGFSFDNFRKTIVLSYIKENYQHFQEEQLPNIMVIF